MYPFLLWCNNLFLFNTNTISLCWGQSTNELVIIECCQSFIIIIIIIIIILKSLTNSEKLHSFVVTRLILSVYSKRDWNYPILFGNLSIKNGPFSAIS